MKHKFHNSYNQLGTLYSLAIALCLFFYCSGSGFSQNGRIIRGKITDPDDKAIQYATVHIKETSWGTITNENGDYRLYINKSSGIDSIFVSCLGYKSHSFDIKRIIDTVFNISLEPLTIELAGVNIYPTDIKKLLEEGINNLKKNYHDKPTIVNGVFHETLKQNDRFVRIADAAVSIYIPSYIKEGKKYNVKLINAKATTDESRLGSIIPYKPKYFLKYMFVNNSIGGIATTGFDKYDFFYIGIIEEDDRELMQIDFNTIPEVEKNFSTSGSVYIDKESKAFVMIKFKSVKNFLSQQVFQHDDRIEKVKIKYTLGEGLIKFSEVNGKWGLSYITGRDLLEVQFNEEPNKYFMEYNIELFINEIVTENIDRFDKNDIINIDEGFYQQIGTYDNSIWDTINTILPTENELIKK